MQDLKNKAILSIEEKLKDLEPDSLRAFVLQKAKDFKSSWLGLGQALYSIWRDKTYKEWGYQLFDTYTAKEIGIKKETALKLLRSYSFLEQEEPEYLKQLQDTQVAVIPNYEAVNTLRLVKNKDLDKSDYARLKKDTLEHGRDVKDLKKDITSLIRSRSELDPETARKAGVKSIANRLLAALRAVKKDAEILKIFPAAIIKDTEKLIARIEEEIE